MVPRRLRRQDPPHHAQRCPVKQPPGDAIPVSGDEANRPPNTKRKSVFRGPNGKPRNRPFPIRLSEEEHQQIATQAGRYRMQMVAYIRARIFDYPLPSMRGAIDSVQYAELTRVILDLRNAGSNINQIAHAYHLGSPEPVQKALQGIVQVREALDRVRLHLVQIAEDFEAPATGGPEDAVEELWGED